MRQILAEKPDRERVSIRTRSFDRVMPSTDRLTALKDEVSIRTRSFDRVMQVPPGAETERKVFQSAPGLSTG